MAELSPVNFTSPYSINATAGIALHFHAEHLADLRASGLTDETIRMAGVYSLAPRFIEYFFKSVPAEIESALCFPYQGGAFARIKLFPALGKMKYAQPSGTSARLYVPFGIGPGAVYVCEGEKKTLAAQQSGLNALGIGGVWSWLSKGSPISDLNLIHWEGRDVTIIPDSDVWQRVDLLRAIYALGRELQSLGANISVAQIAQPVAAKIGLDDFLVTRGKVSDLEAFSLSHSVFKSAQLWHGRWKFNKVLRAA